MAEKRDWMARHGDWVRRATLLEPRGHLDLSGALLTEPASPGAHAGVLAMDGAGFPTAAGSGIAAVVTIALERGLLHPGGDGMSVVLDTVAGIVRATVRFDGSQVVTVSLAQVPSFVLHAGMALKLGSRPVRVDVVFAGAFYAVVDSESAGVGVAVKFIPELRRTGLAIRRELQPRTFAHPEQPAFKGIEGVIFTAPPEHDADLRSATVSAAGAVDRSPGEGATSAILAVLSAMGVLDLGSPFVHESISGSRFIGRIRERTTIAAYDAIVSEVEAAAWITGEHVLLLDDSDPLREGLDSVLF